MVDRTVVAKEYFEFLQAARGSWAAVWRPLLYIVEKHTGLLDWVGQMGRVGLPRWQDEEAGGGNKQVRGAYLLPTYCFTQPTTCPATVPNYCHILFSLFLKSKQEEDWGRYLISYSIVVIQYHGVGRDL